MHLNLIFHYTKREHTWQHHMLSHFPIFLSKKNNKRKGGEKQNSKTVYVHIYIRQYSQFLSKTFIKKRFSPTPLDKRKRNKSTATCRASCGPHLSLSLSDSIISLLSDWKSAMCNGELLSLCRQRE